jgi:hypothetical protein
MVKLILLSLLSFSSQQLTVKQKMSMVKVLWLLTMRRQLFLFRKVKRRLALFVTRGTRFGYAIITDSRIVALRQNPDSDQPGRAASGVVA